MRTLVILLALLLVACSGNTPTAPVAESVRMFPDPVAAADAQVVLTDGLNDYTGQLLWYTGNGPVITDNNVAVNAVLYCQGVSSIRTYQRDEYGNVLNCYDGAAIELLNPSSTLEIFVTDSIIGDMKGILSAGNIIVHADAVIGRQDGAAELKFGSHAIFYCDLIAVGDTGYYGCNAGVGGPSLYCLGNNDTVLVDGDAAARWDYTFKVNSGTVVMITGVIYYFGPRQAIYLNGDGQVVTVGSDEVVTVSLSQTLNGKRSGWLKHGRFWYWNI